MEELKARILEIVEDYEEGISVLDNDMAQAGIDPKSDFVNTIEQLLEERECRAREEGKIEILTDIWDISTTERGKDINWCGEIIAEWVNNYLSKLTTK